MIERVAEKISYPTFIIKDDYKLANKLASAPSYKVLFHTDDIKVLYNLQSPVLCINISDEEIIDKDGWVVTNSLSNLNDDDKIMVINTIINTYIQGGTVL